MAAPELLFTGGRIWPGLGARLVTAVAVAGGRIVAVDDDAVASRGPATEVVALDGRTLLPAFRDGHIHPLAGGTETLDCDLVDAASVAEVQRRLVAFVASDRSGDGGWVLGYGYPPELLPGGVGRASTLDDAVADRPVALWSSDHHMVWVNTRALQVAGIDAGTPDPPRGTIVRDADGAAVGTLLEEAEHLLTPHLPPRDETKEARGLEEGLARMAAAGLVWGQDAWSSPERLGSYTRVADAGRLTADLDIAWKLEPDRWQDQVGAFTDARREVERGAERRRRDGVPGGRLTNRTVKVFVDGVIEGGTGAMLEPYCDHGDLQHAGAPRGILNWERGDLLEAAAAMDAAGFELHMHAIGDAAVRLALDTVAAVASRNGPRDRRPVVAHTHLVHPGDVPRFAELGVIANLEPLWAQRNEIMTEL
ncbi:MAG: amidohydrolase family protein, partial [Actinobacteria bacterium]|nr:amidohydrolase family protein [Actinomycetota bacterium]